MAGPQAAAVRLDPTQALVLRAAFFERTRSFFRRRGFIELDTPLLVRSVPTEGHIAPFPVTLHRRGGVEPRYLPTSPEGALKQQLAILGRDAFELGHAFRDGEEEGPRHRAHFRMLEWYRLDADHHAIRADVVALLADLADFFATEGRALVPTLTPPPALVAPDPEILSIPDAFERFLGHRIDGPGDLEALLGAAHARGHARLATWQEAFHVLSSLEVEPRLGRDRPVFLTDYPAGVAAMARPHADRPWLAQQFELFVDGVELANCYAEITDPALQRERFEAEASHAAAEGRAAPTPEPAFLEALASLPERTAGGSIGVERLLMVWLGADSLDTIRPGW